MGSCSTCWVGGHAPLVTTRALGVHVERRQIGVSNLRRAFYAHASVSVPPGSAGSRRGTRPVCAPVAMFQPSVRPGHRVRP